MPRRDGSGGLSGGGESSLRVAECSHTIATPSEIPVRSIEVMKSLRMGNPLLVYASGVVQEVASERAL